MSRLSTVRIGQSVPRGPLASGIPQGGPRTVSPKPAVTYGDKKRYAGSVAGLRAQRPYSVSTGNLPRPTTSFPSVQLGRRMASQQARTSPRASLLNRVVTRARAAVFGL